MAKENPYIRDFLRNPIRRKVDPHYHLIERRLGDVNEPNAIKLEPLIQSLKFHIAQMSAQYNCSRSLYGSNEFGSVYVHRISNTMENIYIKVKGGGYIILLHQERGVVTIFDWEGGLYKTIQLYTPLHSPLTREEFDTWITPEIHDPPTGYPTGTGYDWIYWFWWWGLKPAVYIMDGDSFGFCSVYGGAEYFYTDIGTIAYGHRYDWTGTFKYAIDLGVASFPPYTVLNRWWYTRDTDDGQKHYSIIIQRWHTGQGSGDTEKTFVILYEVNPTTFAYTMVGYVETPEVTLTSSVHRYNIDCVAMCDDYFYVHYIEGDFTIDFDAGTRQMSNCTHYIVKYDYALTEVDRSAEQAVSTDNYNGYMGPFSYVNGDDETVWVNKFLWFGDDYENSLFYIGYNRLYAGDDYIVYSSMSGQYHASWNDDLTFRSDGLSPETVQRAPFNHRSLAYLGTKDNKVYMYDSKLLTPDGQEASIDDYATAIADRYNYDSEESDVYDVTIPAYGAMMQRTYCTYLNNLYYREAMLPGFVIDGLKI